jgi:hypothetical protein
MTRNNIIMLSRLYHAEHGVTEADVAKANKLIQGIESTRDPSRPVAGDRMICCGPQKTYENGHIASSDLTRHSSVCVQPYVPIIGDHIFDDCSYMSTSGGYWFSLCPDELGSITRLGPAEKMFSAWGHNGSCGNGTFTFTAEVNVWRFYRSDIY